MIADPIQLHIFEISEQVKAQPLIVSVSQPVVQIGTCTSCYRENVEVEDRGHTLKDGVLVKRYWCVDWATCCLETPVLEKF